MIRYTAETLRAGREETKAMAKHVHRCTRTKPLHTPCRCKCGAERVTPNACMAEVPRTGGRWIAVDRHIKGGG